MGKTSVVGAKASRAAARASGGAGGGEEAGPSGARVMFSPDYSKAQQARLLAKAKAQFGEHFTLRDFASAVGAPRNAMVVVSPSGDTATYGKNSFSVSVTGPGFQAERTLYRDRKGRMVIKNEFFVTETTGTGLGTRVFGRQVAQAARLGFRAIHTEAAGKGSGVPGVKTTGYNGYYTWAKLGYNAKITPKIRERMPAEFAKSRTIAELFRTSAGRDWWKTHGGTLDMRFNLAPGSRSRRRFEAHLKESATK